MEMTLALFIAVPLVFGLAGWALGMRHAAVSRIATLVGSLASLVLALAFWIGGAPPTRLELPWIPSMGASFSLSLDGLSLPFIALAVTAITGVERRPSSSRIAASTAMPSMTGSAMSERMMSGRCSFASCTAVSPSIASISS